MTRIALLLAVALPLVAALPLAAAPATAQAPPAAAPRPAPIDRNGVLVLARSALLAVAQANLTGDYGVLHRLGSPSFQERNPPERLAEIFAPLRAQGHDLTGVLVLEPQLTLLPEIDANGALRMAGVFPSAPLQVAFDLQFAPLAGRWALLGVSVAVRPSVPTPPEPAAAPPAAPRPAAPPPARPPARP